MAAGLAPRARSRALAALSSVSQAHPPPLSEARRDRPGRRRGRPDLDVDLADLDGVQKGPPHPARRAAARRRWQPVLHALSRRLQHRHQHHLFRRRQGVVSAAADHSVIMTEPQPASPQPPAWHFSWQLFARKDVLSGLLFVAVALAGLWISRDYP